MVVKFTKPRSHMAGRRFGRCCQQVRVRRVETDGGLDWLQVVSKQSSRAVMVTASGSHRKTSAVTVMPRCSWGASSEIVKTTPVSGRAGNRQGAADGHAAHAGVGGVTCDRQPVHGVGDHNVVAVRLPLLVTKNFHRASLVRTVYLMGVAKSSRLGARYSWFCVAAWP